LTQLSRRTFLELAGASLLCGCSGTPNFAGSSFSGLVFSDVHFNPFYDPTLLPSLIAADVSDWAGIFALSSVTTPSLAGFDTNYPLLVLALASINRNLGASPVVIYTGDLLGHGIPQYYQAYTGSSDPDAIVSFTNKTVTFVMQQIRAAVGDIPVLFAVGNGDSYTGYGPDSTFLANTAELFYAQFLQGSVDHQTFLTSFTSGGYYCAQPLGSNLRVISLNTIMCSPLVQSPSGSESTLSDVTAEMDWLDAQLASAQAADQKVWLLMHVPTGADEGTTAGNISNNGQITSDTTTMMWVEDYQTKFFKILAKYPGVITLTLAGHTHMDEYRILSPGNTLEITPGISPYFKNNPAYKIFTFAQDTLMPTDYSVLNYDLTTPSAQFNSYYTFSQAYCMAGRLPYSLISLRPLLAWDSAEQALYRSRFYSGNDSHNAITNANWPVYWGGIKAMTEEELVASVDAY
jgi:sphingomyelin phosphodiesterase acid-like 3